MRRRDPRPDRTAGALSLLLLSACAAGGAGAGPAPTETPAPTAGEAGPGRERRPQVVPVLFPGRRVPCLFEALAVITAWSPFPTGAPRSSRSDTQLAAAVAKLAREAARAGGDAAIVRRLLYDHRPPTIPGRPPEVLGIQALLVRFVDGDCQMPDPGR